MKNQLIPDFIIVDDDELNNLICKKAILSILPHAHIRAFTLPEEALTYLKTAYPGPSPAKVVLFLDINMSTISGWDFLKIFDGYDISVKEFLHIYMLSSSVNPMDKVRAANNKSLWNYIEKPLTRQVVRDIVAKVREEESTSFSRSIQDKLGQQLMRIKMDAVWLSSRIKSPDAEVRDKISAFIGLIDQTIETTRGIGTELRPRILDDLGLFAALEWQAGEFTRETGIPCKLKIELAEPELSKLSTMNIFTIFREALDNIDRHAHAEKVDIRLNYNDGNMMMSVEDDGDGFNAKKIKNKGSSGLLRMQKLAAGMNGKLKLRSAPGKGTNVELLVPVII